MLSSFRDVWNLPASRFFWCEREGGQTRCGHPEGYYLRGADPGAATYDTGNNKAIALQGPDGELKRLTLFKESYFADDIPGVWVHKGRVLAGPFGFSLREGDETRYLPAHEGRVRTDLIECALPVTRYDLRDMTAAACAFAPLSRDGGERPRGAFYLLWLENHAPEAREGAVLGPDLGHFSEVAAHGDDAQIDIRNAADGGRVREMPFRLNPGEGQLFALWLGAYGEEGDFPLARRGALYWLWETLAYYRHLTGDVHFAQEPLFEEFYRRAAQQCQQAVGMAPSGRLAGSSWGTNPTTHQIWLKDFYYTLLPLAQMDPALFRKGVEWFARYCVRPAGVRFAGGVRHSLSNALSAVLLAGQYYAATGDAAFFREHPQLVARLEKILQEMLDARDDKGPWLFPSEWISDGLCLGDFHTGTNVTAWAALKSLARILREVQGEEGRARDCEAVAGRVREAILAHCAIQDGPYGPQLAEGCGEGPPELRARMKAASPEELQRLHRGFGVQFYDFYNREAGKPYLVHDGEETDTTLCSFYGLLAFDDPLYKNATRCALSQHNRFYRPVSQGILWEECTDSTFPGYVTGLANAVDRESFARYFDPIARLCDLDGSIWWWPYPYKAEDNAVMRREPGKCGWAAGALLILARHDLLGLRYDAPRRALTLIPSGALDVFELKDAPLGGARFDVCYDRGRAEIVNRNAFSVQLTVQLPGEALQCDGAARACERVWYVHRPHVKACERILPGERVCYAAR